MNTSSTLKSIVSVIAGFLIVVVLSMGTDWILETLYIFPPVSDQGLFVTWMLAFALLYRTIFTVLGGYVTARLAPNMPMRHVIILAIFGTMGGIAGIFTGWDLSAHWYPIALALLAFPSVWIGGKIATR